MIIGIARTDRLFLFGVAAGLEGLGAGIGFAGIHQRDDAIPF